MILTKFRQQIFVIFIINTLCLSSITMAKILNIQQRKLQIEEDLTDPVQAFIANDNYVPHIQRKTVQLTVRN